MMRKRGSKHERGQSLVEFALSLPILILILSGLIDIGRVYFAYIFLEEAAAEAALYVALNPDCTNENGLPKCVNPNNAEWRARNSGSSQGIVRRDTLFVSATTSGGGFNIGVGDVVTVNATMEFAFSMPGMAAVMQTINANGSNVLLLSVQATHLVVTE